MKRVICIILMTWSGWAFSGPASTGVIGIGNSADLSFQLDFAKSTAVSILAKVDAQRLTDVGAPAELVAVYAACRPAMYVGALHTKFVVVETIPDGEGYHAIARRNSGYEMLIGRRQLDMTSSAMNPTLLVGLILHEVGHDCRIDEVKVDDAFDSTLNALSVKLIEASNVNSLSHFIDLDFVERVRAGQEEVEFHEMSSGVRAQVVDKYLDYVGEWLFTQFKKDIGEKPAAGSDYDANPRVSWSPAWSKVVQTTANPKLKFLAPRLLKGSQDSTEFFIWDRDTKSLLDLPSKVRCAISAQADTEVDCLLEIFWDMVGPEFKLHSTFIRYSVDIFSKVRVKEILIFRSSEAL